METVGAELSIMMPVIGPAVAQIPTLLQTCTELVESFPFPVPAATGSEVSVMVAWAGLARPEPASVTVQVNETVPECHLPSALGQLTVGGALSIMKGPWPGIGVQFPTLSQICPAAVYALGL